MYAESRMQAMLGVASGVLAVIGMVTAVTLKFSEKFAALDTRMAKLESAIRAMNATTPDERYRTLIKELIAKERENRSPLTGQSIQGFGGNSFPADAGASASSPAMVKPQ